VKNVMKDVFHVNLIQKIVLNALINRIIGLNLLVNVSKDISMILIFVINVPINALSVNINSTFV
jgi:hypothetical protein